MALGLVYQMLVRVLSWVALLATALAGSSATSAIAAEQLPPGWCW